MNDKSGDHSGRLLSAAHAAVTGARQEQHGDKAVSFVAIARLWNAYLDARARAGRSIDARDVAWMMVLLKIARSIHGDPQAEDHYVDAAGYAAIAGEVASLSTRQS